MPSHIKKTHQPRVGVGVVCLKPPGEVLLIRRGKAPRAGEWSIPGGGLEWGEALAVAALRELLEETGVTADMLGLIDVVDGLFDKDELGVAQTHYVLVDYAMLWLDGTPKAGDDAVEAVFVPLSELGDYDLWPETERIIRTAIARWPHAVRAEIDRH